MRSITKNNRLLKIIFHNIIFNWNGMNNSPHNNSSRDIIFFDIMTKN